MGDKGAHLAVALAGMSARELVKRAEAMDIEEEKLAEADEAQDRKAALISLIEQHAVDQRAGPDAEGDELRAELLGMNARALTKRAEAMHIDEGKLAEADESEDRKGALIALILAESSSKEEGAALRVRGGPESADGQPIGSASAPQAPAGR